MTRSASGSPLATPWRNASDEVSSGVWACHGEPSARAVRPAGGPPGQRWPVGSRSDPTDAAALQRNSRRVRDTGEGSYTGTTDAALVSHPRAADRFPRRSCRSPPWARPPCPRMRTTATMRRAGRWLLSTMRRRIGSSRRRPTVTSTRCTASSVTGCARSSPEPRQDSSPRRRLKPALPSTSSSSRLRAAHRLRSRRLRSPPQSPIHA